MTSAAGTALAYVAGMDFTSLLFAALVSAVSAPATTPNSITATSGSQAPGFVVEKSIAGPGAAELFLGELRAHLEDGYLVVGISRQENRVEIDLHGRELITVQAVLDEHGHVAVAEVATNLSHRGSLEQGTPTEPAAWLPKLGAKTRLSVQEGAEGPVLLLREEEGITHTVELSRVADFEGC